VEQKPQRFCFLFYPEPKGKENRVFQTGRHEFILGAYYSGHKTLSGINVLKT
jgi:hypothetical protein